MVTATALNVRARPGVAANNPPVGVLRTGAEVTIYGTQTVAGELWYRVGDARWVISTWVRLFDSSSRSLDMMTVTAATPAQLPVGWVAVDSRTVRAHPGVSADNLPIGEVLHNQPVAVLEERIVAGAKWYRIGEGQWVEGDGIGVARLRSRLPASGSGNGGSASAWQSRRWSPTRAIGPFTRR